MAGARFVVCGLAVLTLLLALAAAAADDQLVVKVTKEPPASCQRKTKAG